VQQNTGLDDSFFSNVLNVVHTAKYRALIIPRNIDHPQVQCGKRRYIIKNNSDKFRKVWHFASIHVQCRHTTASLSSTITSLNLTQTCMTTYMVKVKVHPIKGPEGPRGG
jgi:hypothetical protein